MTTRRHEIRTLLRLAVPVVITQVSLMMMGVVDIIMVGHAGLDVLGAATLGRVWIFGTLLMTMGVVMGVDPIISQAHGRRDATRLGLALQQGLVVALIVSLPLAVLWYFTEPVLRLFGQDPGLSAQAKHYVWVQIPTIPTFLGYTVLRQYLQGRGIMRPAMVVAIGANLVNVLLNWLLIFGHAGFPELGLVGAGIATACVRVFMFLALIGVVIRFRLHVGAWIPWSRKALRLPGIQEILHYGIPIGIAFGFEIWAFEIATLMAGRMGGLELAAHVIALNLASMSFMFPLGISMAAVTRVGNLIGEGRSREAQTASWMAFLLGAGVMAVAAVLVVGFRHQVPRAYTSEMPVILLAAAVLPVTGMMQLFDGVQVVGTGILRAMGKTRPAAVFNFVSYYLLGLPLAWWLGFRQGWGVIGIWWGMVLGLSSVAVLLTLWIWRRGPARYAARLHLEPERPSGP